MTSHTDSSKIRLGVIGLGDIGTMHTRGFLREPDVEIAALSDVMPERVERAKSLLPPEHAKRVRTCADYRDLIAAGGLDAVVIGLPVHMHMPAANAALDAGLHIFLEKPIAVTIPECDAFIKKVFASGKVVQVGLVYRYSNLFRTVGRMTESGAFGNVSLTYCKEYRDSFPTPWFFKKNLSGGAIMDKNCHHFDLFNWFIRSQPKRVFAMGGQHVIKGSEARIRCAYSETPGAPIPDPDILDHAFVITEYENGAKSNLGLCMYQLEPVEGLEIGLMGDNGSHALAKLDIALTAGGGPLGESREIPVDYHSDNEGVGHIGCRVQQTEFTRAVKAGSVPYCNLFIARDCMVVCAAAETSIEQDRQVMISEYLDGEVEDIRARLHDELYRATPAPLPPPVDAGPKRPGDLAAVIEILLKMLARRADTTGLSLAVLRMMMSDRGSGVIRGAFNQFLNALALLINRNPDFRRKSRGLDSLIALRLPGAAPLNVRISAGAIAFPAYPTRPPDVTVTLTDAGLRDLMNGADMKRLFFEKKIMVDGNIPLFRLHTDLFAV